MEYYDARDVDGTVQVDRRLLAKLKRAGYDAHHTGGGCMAWRKDLADGGHLLISFEEGLGEWGDRHARGWLIGRYGEDPSDWVNVDAAFDLNEALATAGLLPSPVGNAMLDGELKPVEGW